MLRHGLGGVRVGDVCLFEYFPLLMELCKERLLQSLQNKLACNKSKNQFCFHCALRRSIHLVLLCVIVQYICISAFCLDFISRLTVLALTPNAGSSCVSQRLGLGAPPWSGWCTRQIRSCSAGPHTRCCSTLLPTRGFAQPDSRNLPGCKRPRSRLPGRSDSWRLC